MAGKINLRRSFDPASLRWLQGVGGVVQVCPCLDLDKSEGLGAPGDNINFPCCGSEAALQDLVAAQAKVPTAQKLTKLPKAVGILSFAAWPHLCRAFISRARA